MGVYFIEFNTKEMPGLILGYEVTLKKVVIRDKDAVMRIDLAADPLYQALCRYVKANPPKNPAPNAGTVQQQDVAPWTCICKGVNSARSAYCGGCGRKKSP